MIYLASPYSHPNPRVMVARFHAACLATAELMRRGHTTFSPIAHSHCVATFGNLHLGWEFWSDIDYEWIRLCGNIAVLTLMGWRESVGIRDELRYAESLQLPPPALLSPEDLGIEDVLPDAELAGRVVVKS